jgi:DNA processing protein
LVRNRVIAALTAGTVMVEASARSGARQTLGRAALLGRVVMAVPGPVTSAMSVGCHQAMRQLGARLVTCYADVLDELGPLGTSWTDPPRGPDEDRDSLGADLAQVLDAVPQRGIADPAAIAAAAGVSIRAALQALPALEEAGFVIRRDSGYAVTDHARRRRPAKP